MHIKYEVTLTKLLFTDGSVDHQSKTGYGAFLFVDESELNNPDLKNDIQIKEFKNTSSTQLELETLLWALSQIPNERADLVVYTDSQNIINLPGRRDRLEKHGFMSGKNVLLKHHELYKRFYKQIDELHFTLVKLKGHMRSIKRNEKDQLFSLVDKATRKALKDSKNN